MAISNLLRSFGFVFALLSVLASEDVVNEHKSSTDKRIPVSEATAKDEGGNGTNVNLDYSITVTMVNYGAGKAKVQQRYLFPNGIEVKAYTLRKKGRRTRRSTDNQKLTNWVGGTANLKPSDEKEADLTYINHPGQVINPNSKTFHKLSTAIMIKEGDLLGGKISSPNYPYSYPNGADLTWLIVYPQDNIVKLEMEDYATEECCDRVIVYDGYNKSHYPLATFDGEYSYSNNVVLSTQPAMFIRFTSDCLTTSRGFRASYINQQKSKAPSMSCGYVHQTNGNEGYIQSPNYPATYAQYMSCNWPIQTYYNTRVKFVIDNFTIGSDDNLAIYEGSPNNPGNRIANLNGNMYSGFTVYASSNEAFVAFTSGSDRYITNMFVIFYTGISNYAQTTTPAVDSSSSSLYYDPPQCHSEASSLYGNGSLVSPGFLSPTYYANNEDCIWYLTVSGSYGYDAVVFVSQYFSLQYNWDFVKIYNHHSLSSSDLIREITGFVDPNTTIAVVNSTTATLRFTTDDAILDRGFDILFSGGYYADFVNMAPTVTTSPTCPYSNYNGYVGQVNSPYFPDNYDNNMNCTQWVHTPYETVVQLSVQYFYLNVYDYVNIYDGYTGQFLQSMTDYYPSGYSWLAPSNYIKIVFISDSNYTSTGYSFHYDSVSTTTSTESNNTCGGKTHFNTGVITSPNYPTYYSNNLYCVWTVSVSSNMYVLFTVEYFDTEGCCDYVSFYIGTPNNSSAPVESLRGSVSNGYEILVRDSHAWLLFNSDSSVNEPGFVITYRPETIDYIPNNDVTTIGYDVVTESYNDVTQGVRSGLKTENGRKTLGKDQWGNKQKPAHLRKDDIGKKDQQKTP